MTLLTALATLLALQDLFAGNPREQVAKEDASKVELRDSGGAPALAAADSRFRFRRLAVKPASKMSLTLECAFEGEVESIEENPRFEIFTRLGKTSPRLPMRAVRFFDKEGKPVGARLAWAMPFRNRRTYVDTFYTPVDAASVEVALAANRGIRLLVSGAKLEETPDEGALNSNPSFALGRFNYSGWENISRGGKIIERMGKAVLDTKYGSTTRKIPLPGPGRYAFSAKATGNGFNSIVRIRVYDGAGKKLMEMGTRKYGPPVSFVPPKDAVYASFLVYSCLLEEVRLVRVGDE